MKRIIKSSLLISIIILSLGMWIGVSKAATNFSENDIEWNSATSGTLYRGDTLTNGEYSIKAVQFSQPVPGVKNIQGNIVPSTSVSPAIYLDIYKNEQLIGEIIMDMASKPYISPDYEVKISVTGFLQRNSRQWVYEYYNPWATVSIQTRAVPNLNVEILTDKSDYASYDDKMITAKVVIANGDAFVKNVSVELNIDGLKLQVGNSGDLHQNYYKIDANSVESFGVKLNVPELAEETSYNLTADATGYDAKNIEYIANSSTTITVTPKEYLTISKGLRDRIYLGDNESVKIIVSNGWVYDINNITVTDDMSENFALSDNGSKLEWHIPVLKPGQEWDITYTARPLKANLEGFSIPSAVARFTINNRDYKTSSDNTNVIVNGPIIILTKTVDKDYAKLGEDVEVTVSINDVGDIPTRVEVKDSLPDDITMVSGQTSLGSTFLELNSPQEFSYVIRKSSEGETILPVAVAHFTDIAYRDTKWSEIESNRPVINFSNKILSSSDSSTNPDTNSNTSTDKNSNINSNDSGSAKNVSGFGVTLPIIVMIIIYYFRKSK